MTNNDLKITQEDIIHPDNVGPAVDDLRADGHSDEDILSWVAEQAPELMADFETYLNKNA